MKAIASASVAWIAREDWDEVKSLCAGDLQETYDEWLLATEQGIAEHTQSGLLIEKVIVTPDDIRRRERATGRKVDGPGRAKIALKKFVESEKGRTRN